MTNIIIRVEGNQIPDIRKLIELIDADGMPFRVEVERETHTTDPPNIREIRRIAREFEKAKKHPENFEKKVEKQCPVCGKTFVPKRKDSFYCSKKCRVSVSNRKHRLKAKQNKGTITEEERRELMDRCRQDTPAEMERPVHYSLGHD